MDSTRDQQGIITSIIAPKEIVKGKRTKRQRPQSPIPGAGTHNVISYNNNNDINSSPANSAGTTTEEEEDTAKCLILLSQGPSPDSPNHNHNHNDDELGTTSYKFTSKRYIETNTTGNGKAAGIYVYECKTCNRTFPSFQALGGHRASHKKTKPAAAAALDDNKKRPLIMALSDEEFKHNTNYMINLQLGNKPAHQLYKSAGVSNKFHECAICGAEFTSGQALGGHMRRHRNPVVVAAAGDGGANTTLSLSPTNTPIGIDNSPQESNKKPKTGFYLDLNLPATPEPEEEFVNNGESKRFTKHQIQTTSHHHHHHQQQQQKQQSPLVLSAAPTLVDCHY